MEKPHVRAIRRAVKIAGGQTGLACRLRDLGFKKASQALVWNWINNEVLLDAKWWGPIEVITSGEVTRIQLRPDVDFSRDHAA